MISVAGIIGQGFGFAVGFVALSALLVASKTYGRTTDDPRLKILERS
jgi:hypothetical protein